MVSVARFQPLSNYMSLIKINIDKAKVVAHTERRIVRAKMFQPLDVEATIPTKAIEAEAKRQEIREYFDVVQEEIDAASTPEQIKAKIDEMVSLV